MVLVKRRRRELVPCSKAYSVGGRAWCFAIAAVFACLHNAVSFGDSKNSKTVVIEAPASKFKDLVKKKGAQSIRAEQTA